MLFRHKYRCSNTDLVGSSHSSIMRLLILLFLFGISCSKPVYNALEFAEDESLADEESVLSRKMVSVLSAERDEPETELVKKYKEAIEAIVDETEYAIDSGKKIKRSLFDRAEEFLEAIRKHIKDLTIKLGISLREKEDKKRAAPETEVVKKYREAIDAIVDEIEDAIANRKKIKRGLLDKFVAIRQKIIDNKDEVGEKEAEELLQKIRKHVKDLTIKLVISLREKEEQKRYADENKIRKELREALDTVLEKIKEALDHGKSVKAELLEKMRELRQKFKDLKMDLSERAKELLQKIKDRAKDFLRKLLETFGIIKIENDAIMAEYLKEHPELRNAIRKLEEWLIGHIPGVSKDVVAKANEFLRSCKKY